MRNDEFSFVKSAMPFEIVRIPRFAVHDFESVLEVREVLRLKAYGV